MTAAAPAARTLRRADDDSEVVADLRRRVTCFRIRAAIDDVAARLG